MRNVINRYKMFA